ncbi:hypothetical protein CFP71_18120 [Amycolatopsis thailandensis]|uniref:Uncharacterized protein n=1 Tax=Amycolatopsis thailandensis TaxID=589330 RepID=A0A229S8I1_9PSEU|nr:hypothetical protein [Amycolatopsis thailandensis]OXM55218.1 hypothetical protein CFP71_18120 [Amycolatopsis thailandensis]
MKIRTAMRFGVTAVVACLVAGCGSNPPESASAPSSAAPSPAGPDPALVSWAGGYCAAVKDMRLIVYSLAKSFDIESEADLPKAAASLEKLDTALTAAIGGLEKLPQAGPPAQEADTLASGELAFYRKLHGKVTEYRTLLPRAGVEYAKAALNLSGADLVSHVPSVETAKVPGLDQAMKADKACELVG